MGGGGWQTPAKFDARFSASKIAFIQKWQLSVMNLKLDDTFDPLRILSRQLLDPLVKTQEDLKSGFCFKQLLFYHFKAKYNLCLGDGS